MVKADNVGFRLKNGRKILEGVTLGLKSSEICVVIGPNGAGKSTLMKVMNGIIKPTDGRVDIGDECVSGMQRRDIAKKIAYLPQTTHPVPCSVYETVLLGRKPYMSWHPKKDDHEMTEDVMRELGISSMRDKCVTELSGGEFQKILIARAMVQKADILMLDEPINHLDVKNQLEIMDTAERVTKEHGLSTMIVLHDLNLALRYADSVLLMDGGRSLYCGDKDGMSEEKLSEAYGINISVKKIDDRSVVMY
ncbi:MAG: ABC transporter ATP-binding protein [Deferribacterales bacterium]